MEETANEVDLALFPSGDELMNSNLLEENSLENLIGIGAEGVFYVVTVIFIFMSLAFVYHWWTYAVHKTYTLVMITIYFAVSALIFIGLLLSLLAL